METIQQLLAANDDAWCVGGGADPAWIAQAEELLGIRFGNEYRAFLAQFGWLEIYNTYFFGVPADLENDACSVVRMTRYARQEWALPPTLVVMHSSDDQVLWCLEGDAVVAFDTHTKKITGKVGPGYFQVLGEYLALPAA